MFVCVKNGIIKAVSESRIRIADTKTFETSDLDLSDPKSLVGKKVKLGASRPLSSLRVAFICNWGDFCGIATYTQALVSSLRGVVGELKIFAEKTETDTSNDDGDNVVRCWTRGDSMLSTIEQVLAFEPDIVHVEHEFGLFPKATHFLKMLEALGEVPYIVTLHSVYEHLDKSICTAYIRNVLVHSEVAKSVLLGLGHSSSVYVIPHGCVVHSDVSELWNIFRTDYTVIQFGFGFGYKGVDIAIEAIKILKETDPKFKDIFYCYLCSENPHTKNAHDDYYSYLKEKVAAAGLSEHVAIMRGFLSDKLIRNFMRTAKLAIFPYQTDPNNCVYGASGAVRHAMANGVPVIASDSHLFDDLEGILPRISNASTLASEIDRVFSDSKYKSDLVEKSLAFLRSNDWSVTAARHVEIYRQVIENFDADSVRIVSFVEHTD